MRHEPRRSTTAKLFALALVLIGAASLAACGSLASGESGEPVVAVPGGDLERGRMALERYACVTCHTVPGVRAPQTYVGPPLTAWAERIFIAGTLPNEPDNLIQWIMEPGSIRPGTAMPDMGVSEGDARDIAAYLYSLTE